VGDGRASFARRGCTSGTWAKRMNRYPARSRSAARAASASSRPVCEASSSSITAVTVNDRSHKTKSATLRSYLLRCARSLVMSAENATCVSTTASGNASLSRQYIACSRLVAMGFRRVANVSGRPLLPFSAAAMAMAATRNIAIAINGKGKCFMSFSCGVLSRRESTR